MSATMNSDGTVNLSNGAVFELSWEDGDIQVTVYGTPEADSHPFGWNCNLFPGWTKKSVVVVWLVERGVTLAEAVELADYFERVYEFHTN